MANEHTDKRYEEELKKLREEILYMGGLVEDQIQKAVKSLVDRDSELLKSLSSETMKSIVSMSISMISAFDCWRCTSPPAATCDSSPPA